MNMELNVMNWRLAVGTGLYPPSPDGPDLLLPEIAALLYGLKVWVPYRASVSLISERWLGEHWMFARDHCSHCVKGTEAVPLPPADAFDAMYFGVPTVVANSALFGAPGWDRQSARHHAKILTHRAISIGARLIVSGLGSGDISTHERLEDMGGGEIVAYKRFQDFKDWLLVRSL